MPRELADAKINIFSSLKDAELWGWATRQAHESAGVEAIWGGLGWGGLGPGLSVWNIHAPGETRSRVKGGGLSFP